MKRIRNIFSHDLKKITGSVVAIITIMGLCIVPCLYAWFNIFSNWAPYESAATGRIPVAVVSEDEGCDMLGLNINVGEKIVDALKANDDIGWDFLETSEEAIEGVKASDYYAALVIPEGFSDDVLSFISGELTNPKLEYYENEKKNAIAPKITGKAKTAVQEEVNAAFIETLASYLSDAASVAEATGIDPQQTFADLSDKMAILSERLDTCIVLVDATAGLSDAAGSLMVVSDSLIGDAEKTVTAEQKILDNAEDSLPDGGKITEISDSIKKDAKKLREDISSLSDAIDLASVDMDSFNEFVEKNLPGRKKLTEAMRSSADKLAKNLEKLGFTSAGERFEKTEKKLEDIRDKLDSLEKADETTWPDMQAVLEDLKKDLADAGLTVDLINDDMNGVKSGGSLADAIKNARKAISNVNSSLSNANSDLSRLSKVLTGYEKALDKLDRSLGSTKKSLRSMQNGLGVVSDIFDRLSGNNALEDINELMAGDEDSVAAYLASPMKMETVNVYPVREYGSAMAPFYTVLAQWVGSLLTAVLIKVRVKNRKELDGLRLHERFLGRFGLFLVIGLAQALIVSLGDLIYVGIQCLHPVLFVLAACVNGITFMMINYALVFALDNIGLGAGVIILVLQVAGGGGTYPVEVLPRIFRALYPIMPFRYAMDAMRECVAGTYDGTYIKCLGILAAFTLAAALLGLLLYKPALSLNRLIAESKQKSEIML